MRAVLVDNPDVLIDAPEAVLEHRRLLGLDKKDECWDGEWHLVNPPKLWHSRLATNLLLLLGPIARSVGLEPYGDCAGVFGAENNWRVPDQVYARHDAGFEDGLRSAELLVEVRSPGDESYKKLPFYASRGIGEVLIIHRDRTFELRRLGGDGAYFEVGADDDGVTSSSALPVGLQTVKGPALRITWEGGAAEV